MPLPRSTSPRPSGSMRKSSCQAFGSTWLSCGQAENAEGAETVRHDGAPVASPLFLYRPHNPRKPAGDPYRLADLMALLRKYGETA